MDINEKLDIIMNMLKDFTLKFEAIDKRLDAIEQRLDSIEQRLDAVEQRLDSVEQRLDAVEQRLDAVEQRLDSVEQRLDAVEQRLDILTGGNREEHSKMMNLITNLTSSFTRFEAEYTDKYKILFDMTQDYIEHKSIVATQLTSLEEKVKNHSYRISNLEKAI